jgi:uncharacterized protein YbaR (Trm112 family)/ubiquinone/menaquinone biosynthesis C-methylase UbiE
MKYRLLNYLVCPECGGELKITAFKENRVQSVHTKEIKRCEQSCAFKEHKDSASVSDCALCVTYEIEAGMLSCNCKNVYPVADGIPRMLPDAFGELGEFSERYKDFLDRVQAGKAYKKDASVERALTMQRKTQASFGYQWLRYNFNDAFEDRKIFLDDSQLSEACLKGKVVLDAGCGMGRYTAIAAGMADEIIGLDLSRSILKAHEKTGIHPLAHIIQADILHPPLRKKQFDVIYSLGVLHHTPDPRQAFLNLVKCLKMEGIISIWMYGAAGQFSEFKTYPLRADRKKYVNNSFTQGVYWFIVALRELIYNWVRLVTTRMSVPVLYMLCYPLSAVGKVPLLKYLTASVHPNWRVRLQENFDWFSPEYQSHHTRKEVKGWFDEAGVEVVSLLKHGFIPKVGMKGVLRSRL